MAFEGRLDDSSNSWGYNLLNGVDFVGELPRSHTDLDYFTLSGSFTVRRSTFRAVNYGAYVGGFVRDARVTLGGAPADGNTFEDVFVGMDLESSENSRTEVSHNRVEGQINPLWVISWCCWTPERPSTYAIHDNLFIPTAPFAEGIYLSDDVTRPWIRASIYGNRIEPRQVPVWDAIGIYHTVGTVVWNNTIQGEGADAIGLWGARNGTVLGNDLSGFLADPAQGLAQVYLDPDASHNLVVCRTPLDTVLDQGTDNKVLGGYPQPKALPSLAKRADGEARHLRFAQWKRQRPAR